MLDTLDSLTDWLINIPEWQRPIMISESCPSALLRHVPARCWTDILPPPLQLMTRVWWHYRWPSVTRSSPTRWYLNTRLALCLHCRHPSTTGSLSMVGLCSHSYLSLVFPAHFIVGGFSHHNVIFRHLELIKKPSNSLQSWCIFL